MTTVYCDWYTGQKPGLMSTLKPGLDTKISKAISQIKPKPTQVECFRDVGWPWVKVGFGSTVHPDLVFKIGDAISKAVGLTVLFHALHPNAIYYLIEERSFQAPADEDFDADIYAEKLDALQKVWLAKPTKSR